MGTLKKILHKQYAKKIKVLLSFLRALFSSWKSGKLSQESCGCASSAESISTEYRDKNFSACSANNSGHQANACKHDKIELLNMSQSKEMCSIYGRMHITSCLIWEGRMGQVKNVKLFYKTLHQKCEKSNTLLWERWHDQNKNVTQKNFKKEYKCLQLFFQRAKKSMKASPLKKITVYVPFDFIKF